jgi:pyrroloquinoline quinone biosynthesis protein B
VRVRVLGSAAGGGFPQWNCACRNCSGVRAGTLPARTRLQASIAVSAAEGRWLLVNATPDIGAQLARLADDSGAVRRSPVTAVLLTDAELDHITGLLSLREGSGLIVYATAWIMRAAAPVLDILSAYAPVDRRELAVGADVPVDEAAGLSCRAIATGSTKRPRYARNLEPDPAAVVGYRFHDAGGSLAYVPCLPALTDDVAAELKDADCAFLDGTCWTDDELTSVGLASKTSRSMGHAPVTDTLDRFAALPVRRRIYTHLNNTNPLLVEDSPERRQVAAAGVEVAYDGMEIDIP